jgi:hypothetical protein
MALHAEYFDKEPDRITVFFGSVRLQYGDEVALVRRSDWRVYQPFDTREADIVQSLGVGGRARLDVQRREGYWLSKPGPEFSMASQTFRQQLSR